MYAVDPGDYLAALSIAREHSIGVNDAVAVLFMRRLGLSEIYSFDRDFDRIPGIRRLTS